MHFSAACWCRSSLSRLQLTHTLAPRVQLNECRTAAASAAALWLAAAYAQHMLPAHNGLRERETHFPFFIHAFTTFSTLLYNDWSGNKRRLRSTLRSASRAPPLLRFSAAQLWQMQQWFPFCNALCTPLLCPQLGNRLPLLADIVAFRYGTGCVARCIASPCAVLCTHCTFSLLKMCPRMHALPYKQTQTNAKACA